MEDDVELAAVVAALQVVRHALDGRVERALLACRVDALHAVNQHLARERAPARRRQPTCALEQQFPVRRCMAHVSTPLCLAALTTGAGTFDRGQRSRRDGTPDVKTCPEISSLVHDVYIFCTSTVLRPFNKVILKAIHERSLPAADIGQASGGPDGSGSSRRRPAVRDRFSSDSSRLEVSACAPGRLWWPPRASGGQPREAPRREPLRPREGLPGGLEVARAQRRQAVRGFGRLSPPLSALSAGADWPRLLGQIEGAASFRLPLAELTPQEAFRAD